MQSVQSICDLWVIVPPAPCHGSCTGQGTALIVLCSILECRWNMPGPNEVANPVMPGCTWLRPARGKILEGIPAVRQIVTHCCKVQAEGVREQATHETSGLPNAERHTEPEVVEEQAGGLPGSTGHDTDVRHGSAAAEQEARHPQPARPSDMHEGVHSELLSAQV